MRSLTSASRFGDNVKDPKKIFVSLKDKAVALWNETKEALASAFDFRPAALAYAA